MNIFWEACQVMTARLGKVVQHPGEHPEFQVDQGLLYIAERGQLCVPNAFVKGRRVSEILMDLAHSALGHMGRARTLAYLRQWYWWPTMAADVQQYCKSCGTCQMMKTSTQRPQGLLHSLPIPTRPWGSIGMDFAGPFPVSDGYDYLMIVICRLTSMVHLVPTTTTVTATEVAGLMAREVVRLHGLPDSIVSDRDPKFTSTMWRELHRILGIKLLMSTAFHPQTDGASERAVRLVSQIMRTVVDSDQKNWSQTLSAVKLALNSSVSASTEFAPFELNYGWLPRLINRPQTDTPFKGVQQFVDRAVENLDRVFDAILASRIAQRDQANKHRRADDPLLEVGSKAYLLTENLALPKGRAGKLLPKYIGPYAIIGRNPAKSTYTLELPEELKRRRIHPTFHARLLRPHFPNNDSLFPGREAGHYYDFGADPEHEWVVDEIVNHRRDEEELSFLVRWAHGDTTWEPLANCQELAALDRYLELHGVDIPSKLPE
ncbi:hypothetical protein FRC09_011298 [Ceratobasidium sp. 395]|nr:hypothetical protein FRC09_011298 [Ceratobasidium sp. 395]